MQELKTISMDSGDGVETYVLVPKRQYDREQRQKVINGSQIKRLKWAYQITGIKSYNTLIPILNKYRKFLDIDNGGCVYYPGNSGEPYKFIADEFQQFVMRHKKTFSKAKVH